MVVLLLVTGPNERDEELLKKVCLYVSWDDPVKLEISVPLRGSKIYWLNIKDVII